MRIRDKPTPWMTSQLSKLIKDRDFQHRKARKTKTQHCWTNFRQLNRKVHKSIKKAKSEYYIKLIEESKGNCSKLWKNIKEVLPNKQSGSISTITYENQSFCSTKGIANALNNFFSNIGLKLSENFVNSTNSAADKLSQTDSSFKFVDIAREFVNKELKCLKTNKAIGLDKISARLLKDAADTLTPSITNLLNISIKYAEFPSIWKNAKVSAIFKTGKKEDPSNYRPISVLPVLSKLMEKAVHVQLYNYLHDNKLLSSKQFGFKSKLSTSIAVGQFTDTILNNLDNGLLTGIVFLDLTKAFDTVDRSILLDKLKKYGIDAKELSWFKSYLSNRKQTTCYNNCLSETSVIDMGVPQDSILGPLLFLIYVNDLPNALKFMDVTLYADDTVLYYSSKDMTTLRQTIDADLVNVTSWLALNHLTLNIGKSKSMVIGSSRKLKNLDTTLHHGLESVESFKYLGVMFNKTLSWEDHIHHMHTKVIKKLSLFRRIKEFLPFQARKLFYFTLILPFFDFCDIVWGDRGNLTLMQNLQVLQNKVAKEILDLGYYSSSTKALDVLKWKPLDHRRKTHRCIFLYKYMNNDIDYDFDIKLNKDYHNYNTRTKNNIRKNKSNRKWGHYSMIARASEDWNSLSENTRALKNILTFKKAINNELH